MDCSLCGNVLSGFVAGLGSLITFVVFPVMQIIFAIFGLIFDKILALKDD